MKLPFIFMTDGTTIAVRFPKPVRGEDSIVLGAIKGFIPKECYAIGSAEQRALKWAHKFSAKWQVSKREDGKYDLIIKFATLGDAQDFKNGFNSKVHGS